MEISQFKSFKELMSTPLIEKEQEQVKKIVEEIYNTSFENEIWIGIILEFLNGNQGDKCYGEYYLKPDFGWDTRRCTYRFISTQVDMPHSISDSDVQVLKKFNAKTPFILYDYEEEPTADEFEYLSKKRTLKKVLESIGIEDDLKNHLCEYCFYKVKEIKIKQQQEIECQRNVLSKENLELLFKNHDFKYILKAVKKCEENLDFDLLELISINAQKLLNNPNANLWNKEELKELFIKSRDYPWNMDEMSYEALVNLYNNYIIVRNCERILINIILVISKNYEYFGAILEQLYSIENDNVRLYCCARGDYTKFLNDSSARISKVANIRYQFGEKWNRLSDNDIENQRIKFLMSAHIWWEDYDVILDEEDKSFVYIQSEFFKKAYQGYFDSDILYTIRDSGIFADAVNELINQGEIILNEDKVPDYFKNENIISEQSGDVLAKKLI